MAKAKIKAIIFDLGGVVVHGGYLGFIKHYCAECFTPLGKKKILELEREVNLAKISEKEFFLEIDKIFHVDMKPQKMHNQIVAGMKTNKSLIHLIPKLKKAKIALFSNALGHIAAEVLKKRHLNGKKFFDRIFLSTTLHEAKPDKKAYLDVLTKMKVKPAEALMVDDRLENILPARKIGMKGIVFKNTAQFARELKKFDLI
ncbi:MAG TPA: HAD-IA family hydrolase [Methylomirabilota bacterium]|nr:HAD-IA family hydrolase [Methylomirabilota bacterium]